MTNCPICESENVREIIKWKAYIIYKCRVCKLIFSTPLPSNKELEKFYQGFMFNKPEDYEIQKQIKRRKKELKELFRLPAHSESFSGKKFLDYGGGTGVVYKVASDMGADSYYYDLDEQAKSFSIKKFGLARENIIEEVTQCKIKFDFIFSDNVIEHVKNPEEFTKNLIQQLNPGGKIIIKTPNASNSDLIFNPVISIKGYFLNALKYNSLKKSIYAYLTRFWCCDPPRHLYSFSKDSFKYMMSKIDTKNITYEVLYYEIPWFQNTITKQFFSKDKKLKSFASFAIRLIIFPIIPLEVTLQVMRKLLLKLRILSSGGIILAINKST